jgi:hypothetical protein
MPFQVEDENLTCDEIIFLLSVVRLRSLKPMSPPTYHDVRMMVVL